jgi:hypothetical protein
MFIGRHLSSFKVLIRVEIQDENLHRKSFNNELFCEIYNKMENKKFYNVRTILQCQNNSKVKYQNRIEYP